MADMNEAIGLLEIARNMIRRYQSGACWIVPSFDESSAFLSDSESFIADGCGHKVRYDSDVPARYVRVPLKPARFRVTYDIVTPESAIHGDTAENGFIDALGKRIPALIGKPTPGVEMTLREALALASPDSDCGRWITESDGRLDHATGATETRSIHPPSNITPASYRRLLALMVAS